MEASIPDAKIPGLADRLKEAREKAGKTQKEFAKALRVAERSLQNWEGGLAPKADTLLAYAKYGVDVCWLLTGREGGGVPSAAEAEETYLRPALQEDERQLLEAYRGLGEKQGVVLDYIRGLAARRRLDEDDPPTGPPMPAPRSNAGGAAGG